ncbi:hypothetical protein V6N13_097482 [Hibiscus sabdariffa]
MFFRSSDIPPVSVLNPEKRSRFLKIWRVLKVSKRGFIVIWSSPKLGDFSRFLRGDFIVVVSFYYPLHADLDSLFPSWLSSKLVSLSDMLRLSGLCMFYNLMKVMKASVPIDFFAIIAVP